MKRSRTDLETTSNRNDVDAFLAQVAAVPKRAPSGSRGRLIFSMDATASREPSWDQAASLQAAMFQETNDLGGLDVQLVHYRGFRSCTPRLGAVMRISSYRG